MILLFLIFEAILAIVIFLVLGSILFAVVTEAPFVPTCRRDLRRILQVVKIKPGEVFYDLGSGDGRLVRAAARSGAQAYGFERAWPLVWWSKFIILLFGLRGKALILQADFLKINLNPADIIFCYLTPRAMKHLKPKLETELKLGARMFSRAFTLPDWPPAAVHRFSKYSSPVYEYRK